MERLSRSSTIYQGLFLMIFALYAYERNNAHPLIIQKEGVSAGETSAKPETPTLNNLYRKLKAEEVFQAPVDGLKLIKTDTAIRISLQNDELFRDGDAAIEETWYPLIDQVGSALFPILGTGFKVSFIGFANSLNENESRGAAFQQSPYLFSASRAEWLFRYYDSKYHLKSEQRIFYLSGAGAVPNGKRIEIEIQEN